jgi:hypothetical protein
MMGVSHLKLECQLWTTFRTCSILGFHPPYQRWLILTTSKGAYLPIQIFSDPLKHRLHFGPLSSSILHQNHLVYLPNV